MTRKNTKLFIGIFIVIAYVGIGVFGLFEFNHITETPMTNCPYTENGFSVCDNSLDHINNWQQFSNTTFPVLFIFLSLFLGVVLYFSNKQNFLNLKQYFYKWRYYLDSKKSFNSLNKIVKWLSLLENSPAF
jgi:hypothetical protein